MITIDIKENYHILMYFISFKFKLFINYRFFWHIGNHDVDRSIPYEANTIRGTWKLYSIKKDPTKIYLHLIEGMDLVFAQFA